MIGADFAKREGLGVARIRIADDRQVLAIRLQRQQCAGRQIEIMALCGGRPKVLIGSMYCCRPIHEPFQDTPDAIASTVRLPSAGRSLSGQHRFEER